MSTKKKSKKRAAKRASVRKVKRVPSSRRTPRKRVRQVKKQGKKKRSASSSSIAYTIALPRDVMRSAIRSLRLSSSAARQALASLRKVPAAPGSVYVASREWIGTKQQASALAARVSLVLSYARGRACSGFQPCMPDVVRVPATNPVFATHKRYRDYDLHQIKNGSWEMRYKGEARGYASTLAAAFKKIDARERDRGKDHFAEFDHK